MFIDLNQIYMTVQFRVHKKGEDGAFGDIGNGERVAPYNAFFYTLFAELEVEMNSELVRVTPVLIVTPMYSYICR